MAEETFIPTPGSIGNNPGVDAGAGGVGASTQLDGFNARATGSILERTKNTTLTIRL